MCCKLCSLVASIFDILPNFPEKNNPQDIKDHKLIENIQAL